MGVRVIFRCDHCDAQPDDATHRTLMGQLRDRTFGEFRDALPGGWLIWTAGGPLGSRCYACAAHRGELVSRQRRRVGTIRCGVHAEEPYRALWPNGFTGLDERELGRLLGAPKGTSALA